MSDGNLEKKLALKDLEIKSLLEVTQAINENIAEDKLYRIFQFTLLGHMRISRIALFVKEDKWDRKFSIGGIFEFSEDQLIGMTNTYKKLQYLTGKQEYSFLEKFDVVIPVAHKEQMLAYLLVGGDPVVNPDDEEYLNFIQTLSNILLVAIENKRFERKRRDQEALKRELEIARQFQGMLVPKKLPDLDHFKAQATYIPHHSVGGDYYDLLKIAPNQYLICVADVSGKGVPAAMLMANLQAGLHVLAGRGVSLREMVDDLNKLVYKNANSEYFITFFLGMIDLSKNVMRYINAGHNYPILITQGQVHELDKGTTPLGVMEKLPFLDEEEVAFNNKALLFLYTDGLTETENKEGEEFGTERVEQILHNMLEEPLPLIHEQMLEQLNVFKGPRQRYKDDVTFVSCRIAERLG